MNHIDQQTLELYVLGEKRALALQDEIEKHLDGCAGCRELKARMEDLHESFATRMRTYEDDQSGDLLPRRLRHSLPSTRRLTPLQEVRSTFSAPNSRTRALVLAAKRHPVAATVSVLCMLALIVSFGVLYYKGKTIDANPASYHVNTATNKIEFTNREGESLWQLGTYSAELEDLERVNTSRARFKRIILFDLDNDGKNEIYSMMRDSRERDPVRSLRVFDGTGVEQHTQGWDLTGFRFREFSYTHSPELTWIQDIQGQPRSIFAKWGQRRSPMVMVRYGVRLEQVGTYWHFGNLDGGYEQDLTGDGNNELVLCGYNDVDDHLKTRKFIVMALDPQRIVGQRESSASRGFGYPRTNAELFYVSLPSLNIFSTHTLNRSVQLESFQGENTIRVLVDDSTPGLQHNIEYVFSKDFKLLDIKWNTGLRELISKLNREGKTDAVFDQGLINRLKSQVEWWNGERWQSSWSRILEQ